MRTFCALLVFIMVFYASCFPASAIEINSEFNSKKIEDIHYSFAPTSLEDARQSNLQEWLLLNNKPLNLGLESRPVWIQFKIKNQLSQPLMPLLSLDNPLLNDVSLAHFMGDKLLTSTHIGDTLALSQRVIKSESLLVKLTLPANSETTVYLKVNNDSGIGLRVPLTLWQQDSLLAYKSMVNLLYGLLIGFIFSLAVSSLVLFAFSRKHYFAYAGLITLMLGFFLAYLGGFGFRYAPSNIADLQQLMLPILLMLITISFLPLQRHVCTAIESNLVKGQTIITALYALIILLIWLLPTPSVALFAILSIPVILIYHVVTTLFYLRKNPTSPNKSLLMALGFFLIVVIHFSIALTGFYTVTRASLMLTFAASLGCSFCLSYTVIKLFILQRDEQVTAQQALIAQSAAQDALLNERIELQERTRQELESQVDERTFELQVTLRELEDKNHELEQLNMEDALTGIKNRRFFDKKLLMEIRRSRREQTPLSIIMLDIDKFKSINDNYGHLTGDQVIRAVSDTIKQQLKRPLDEVARYGGEEFVILLPNTDNPGALIIAEQTRLAIANNTVNVAGTIIDFTISAGVYTQIADDIHNPELFTDYADKALYLAKQHGRNQVVNFSIPQ
ncbi:diguanylate cyclase [Pseudoalteromonas sp. Scap03]|uniref:sensor domain-containing diguanylate cyclase n=1 Tax=unclassified Pseudoalteromonas TaxID=194690 RepID=UPI0015B8F451|nr:MULTISPECIES: diguanylate cyclase [unclassified Pseudoalteromonas]NWL14786.1 diguanylate cyclase [Pseudoalteromonas sp. Scap03]QLE82787.1 diguanylate cyclase [Pseudoalteromonas sp. Scap25]QLE90730.1 diguanylate cyclase [Pseudoalteromonas sp. Scap06]